MKIDADGQRRREEIENKAGEEDRAAKTKTSHSIKKAEGQRGEARRKEGVGEKALSARRAPPRASRARVSRAAELIPAL